MKSKRYLEYDNGLIKNTPNLEILCDAFGWNGGTIHQAHEELSLYSPIACSITTAELIKASKPALFILIDQYMKERITNEI